MGPPLTGARRSTSNRIDHTPGPSETTIPNKTARELQKLKHKPRPTRQTEQKPIKKARSRLVGARGKHTRSYRNEDEPSTTIRGQQFIMPRSGENIKGIGNGQILFF